MTLSGVILDFELAAAHETDHNVGLELLEQPHNLEVIGDKAYLSHSKQAELEATKGVRPQTLPRLNQKRKVSTGLRRLFNQLRQTVETINSQLGGQFHIQTNYAHSVEGLGARLYSKLAGPTLSIYLNRCLGQSQFLQIKNLAFPN